MPIWLRRFTYKKIVEHFEKIAEQNKKATTPKNKPSLGPNIKPSFTSKGSKK